MLAIGKEIRYRIRDILAVHWEAFFQSEKRWIRPVVLETVRKLLACRTPALGCHVYVCPDGHETRVVPHSCNSRFCPTCGKHATDRWADGALSDLLEVEYHHVVLSPPWQLRGITAFNRAVCLSVLARAATACLSQWAREQHGMRMGIVTVIHTFGGDLKWHPHLHLLSKARRGELRSPVPVGLVYGPEGRVELDPDGQVQAMVRLFFETFRRTGSAWATVRFFREEACSSPAECARVRTRASWSLRRSSTRAHCRFSRIPATLAPSSSARRAHGGVPWAAVSRSGCRARSGTVSSRTLTPAT